MYKNAKSWASLVEVRTVGLPYSASFLPLDFPGTLGLRGAHSFCRPGNWGPDGKRYRGRGWVFEEDMARPRTQDSWVPVHDLCLCHTVLVILTYYSYLTNWVPGPLRCFDQLQLLLSVTQLCGKTPMSASVTSSKSLKWPEFVGRFSDIKSQTLMLRLFARWNVLHLQHALRITWGGGWGEDWKYKSQKCWLSRFRVWPQNLYFNRDPRWPWRLPPTVPILRYIASIVLCL